MAEINKAGYQEIRKYAQDNWKTIRLHDDNDVQVIKLEVGKDGNAEFVHETEEFTTDYDDLGNPITEDIPKDKLQIKVTVKGSDISSQLPVTFAKSKAYGKYGTVDEEVFEPFEMANEEDELVVTHTIEIPKI